eukprot:4727848-Pyramimonas_sp.AAC.1
MQGRGASRYAVSAKGGVPRMAATRGGLGMGRAFHASGGRRCHAPRGTGAGPGGRQKREASRPATGTRPA